MTSPSLHAVRVRRNIDIPTDEPGVMLSADLFAPDTAEQVPALVTVLPYRKDAWSGLEYGAMFEWIAARGYALLLVDFRGTGASGGTQRGPFDPEEADDGVAAIAWAAAQPWCTGDVGMWGLSYGGYMSLRTASRQPPALRAILPIVGALDPETDFIHPAGMRGGAAAFAEWANELVVMSLLPPLSGEDTDVQQNRWRQRLDTFEPWALTMHDRAPGDLAWRDRVIDASLITVPTYCVAGWRDLFCDGSLRAYDAVQAPKKLLAGPWMHILPSDSPIEPIDFWSTALRWWDHWLKGADTGIMDEPAVTAYMQGAQPHWRHFEHWPPKDAQSLSLNGSPESGLIGADTAAPFPPGTLGQSGAPQIPSDATVGGRGGIWWSGSADGTFGLPADQRDDDRRTVHFTSPPLDTALCLVGHPEVTLSDPLGADVERVVVRLTDVNPAGSSTLITQAITTPGQTSTTLRLWPTFYRLDQGHQLRITLTDADFPHIWPPQHAAVLVAPTVEVRLLTVGNTNPDTALAPIQAATVRQTHTQTDPNSAPIWESVRDPDTDAVTHRWETLKETRTPDMRHHLRHLSRLTAVVRPDSPQSASIIGHTEVHVRMQDGDDIVAQATTRMSHGHIAITASLHKDGQPLYSRHWTSSLSDSPH